MNKNGIIVLVEDDAEDRELICSALKELNVKNKVVKLNNGEEAYQYLNNISVDPFLIISDINMPRMSGIELRDKMQQDGELRLRAVPFLFLTTGTAKDNIINAYAQSVQGFFLKGQSYDQLKKTLARIFDYWTECTEPTFR